MPVNSEYLKSSILEMRKLDIDSLEIFRAAATQGGVASAARTLHRVPSNVTTRIKQLEARLGVTLFRRHGRGLTPTQDGVLLLAYADRLLSLVAEAEAVIGNRNPRGVLRIGSLESTAGARLPSVLARYHEQNPSVRLELVTGTTAALLGRLREHEIEAAFVSEPFSAPGLLSTPVFSEELVLISAHGAPAFGVGQRPRVTTLISFVPGCSYRRRLEEWLGSIGVMPERALEFASYPAIVACVAAGSGIAIVPRSVLDSLQASNDVATHLLPPSIARNTTHLVWHAGPVGVALERLRALLPVPPSQATKRQTSRSRAT